jgi:D-threo-aldose 1-dehydrogenase
MTLARNTTPRGHVEVTRIGLGTGFLVGLFQIDPQADSNATVRAALDAGVNFFDTAPLYGRGQAERALGEALQGVPRDAYVLQTKAGRTIDGYNYSRDAILRSVENSLKLLKTDRLDSVLIHDPDEDPPVQPSHYQEVMDEALPALYELRAQGVIKLIGAGMNQWQMEYEFAKNADVDCFLLAGRYTLLEQASLEFLDYCHKKDISIWLGGVFNSGILATGPRENARYQYKPAPAHILEKATKIEAVCRRHGVALPVAAVHFVLAHPAVKAAVLGAQKPAEVRANVAVMDVTVPAQVWADLKAEGLIEPASPTP